MGKGDGEGNRKGGERDVGDGDGTWCDVDGDDWMIEGWDEVSVVDIDNGDAKGSVWDEGGFMEGCRMQEERELELDMLVAVWI